MGKQAHRDSPWSSSIRWDESITLSLFSFRSQFLSKIGIYALQINDFALIECDWMETDRVSRLTLYFIMAFK